jgi:putative NIF3 family GTP cyclohydrolase 1 type 2
VSLPVQVAYPAGLNPEERTVTTVGIGAGSAGSLVASSGADVWLTGEMSHHEVLAAVASGHTVILCMPFLSFLAVHDVDNFDFFYC